MYKRNIQGYVLMAIFMFTGFYNYSYAENITTQAECYDTLKYNMKVMGENSEAYKGIEEMSYDELKTNFSKYYKNMTSFGVDLDKPLFELRLYSYGKQTSYVHPPVSPFPIYAGSEKWDEAAKQYLIAEEYVNAPDGEKKFLSCSFMNIQAADLMKVSSDNYWYDSEILSIITEKDNYKLWYNENTAIDYEGLPLADFSRLFIFPKATQNDFFNKYDIINAFPSNEVTYDTFESSFEKKTNTGTGDTEDIRSITYDSNGYIQHYSSPNPILQPVELIGDDKIFPLNQFYQAIENTFPEFSKHLSLNGIVHYNIAKLLIVNKENPDLTHIWNTVMLNTDLRKYAHDKTEIQQKDPVLAAYYEKQLENIPSMEIEAKKILSGVMEDSQTEENKGEKENISTGNVTTGEDLEGKIENTISHKYVIGILVLLMIAVLGFVGYTIINMKKKFNK